MRSSILLCMLSYNYMLTKIPAESVGCPEISVEEMIHSSHQNRLKKKKVDSDYYITCEHVISFEEEKGKEMLPSFLFQHI